MPTLVLEHSDDSGSDLLGIALRDHGHRLRVVRGDRGESIPTDLDDIDAIVVTGGAHSPLDDVPWITAEMALLRQAHDAALPVVGICLGSQLLTRALGGKVAPLDGGVSAGWHPVALTPVGREDPIYAGQPWDSMQASWHTYYAAELPEGARILATSDRCPVESWAMGLRTYAARLDRWAEAEPDALSECGLTRDGLRAQTDEHHPVSARLARRLFDMMALLLMPLDRRYAGAERA